LKSDYFVVE